MATPMVSVLMPVYNGEKYLNEAIESILNQTFSDFEFIIINDGSTDTTSNLLESYRLQDQRIKVYRQPNRGLVAALNNGLAHCRGRYIARMDADDISETARLAKQVTFMELHPHIGVCGTWVKTIGATPGHIWKYAADDATLRCQLLFQSVLAHPAAIIRRKILMDSGLQYNLIDAEDYDLWAHIAQRGRLANIQEILLNYRIHDLQTMQQHSLKRETADKQVRLFQLKQLGFQPTPAELDLHQAICLRQFSTRREHVSRVAEWLEKLQTLNRRQVIYPEPEFLVILGKWWFTACRSTYKLGWWVWRRFWTSPLSHTNSLQLKTKLKFGVLCAFSQYRSKT